MALCPDCRTVIPCHCHLTPPVQPRAGVYRADISREEIVDYCEADYILCGE